MNIIAFFRTFASIQNAAQSNNLKLNNSKSRDIVEPEPLSGIVRVRSLKMLVVDIEDNFSIT